ncbi:neural cell adhesion molecule L1 isoform X2 [Spea bombifrons]|uniref:neural cell adhesion molecule L1 isoform X2 n=1 Tax=Spea bombifrons TaxID=233779 RepID=UPI00234BFBA8|nr:neural cell adhesion molecule L1 isoform X2 [Spea bombifrons]
MAVTSGSSLLGTVLFSLLCSTLHAIDIPKDLVYPPVIIDQAPQTYVIYPNEDIILKCEAKRNAKATYRWEKDGAAFDPINDPRVSRKPDSGTLTIINPNGNMMEFKGKYRCFVTNELGTAISHEIKVITQSTPKWQKETIKPIQVEEGESIILPCDPPKSAVRPRVFWMNSTLLHITQDDRVSMSTNGDLYFSNVKITDEHPDYICHAQIPGTRTILQKEPIALKITPTNSVKFRKPKMMMPKDSSSSYLALKGDSLQLDCIAQGLPTPHVEWSALTGSISKDRFHFDEFKKTMRIDNVMYEDDGQYECTATNTEGKVQHTYTVTVESAPYWIKKPENSVYGPGENALIICDVAGKPQPAVTWKINGEPLKESDLNDNRKLKEGSLILLNLQLGDTVVVQCEAENTHGNILANAYVFVVELPPQILTPNDMEYNVVENTDLLMDCRAFGAPVPSITWQDEQMIDVLTVDRFSQYANGTLKVKEVQKEDAGIYDCIATNSKGSARISAVLNVKNATQIIIAPQEQRVRKGWKATFHCKALFDSTLERSRVEWKKDGLEIEEDDDSDKHVIDSNNTLYIADVQEDDQGIYTCVAYTDLDEVEQSAELVVIDLPEPPYDLELSDQQETSVILSWTPGNENNSPTEEFIIEFEDKNFESGVWHELMRVDSDQTSAQLELSPYVNYHFRVRAVNEIGPSNGSSPSEQYETPPAAPTKNPTEVKGEGTEPDNMHITWKPLKGIDWNGPGFQYIVRWRRHSQDETWKERKVQSPPVIVQDTNTFEPYEIKVQSVNEYGKAPEPNSVIGYSGEDIPTSVPQDVGIESINENTVKVAWLPVQKDGLNGHLKGFRVEYTIHGHHRQTKRTEVRGNTTHAVITGLKPFSNYSVTVSILNGKGHGPASESVTFLTDEGVPSPPTNLRLQRLSDTSLMLIWGPPETPNGILTGYVINYVNLSHSEEKISSETIHDPGQQNWTLSRVRPEDNFKFYVYATTSAGLSNHEIIEGSTKQEIEIPPIQNISATVEGRRVTLNWKPLDGKKNVELKVQIRNKSGEHWFLHGNVNSSWLFYDLSELNPGSTYDIRLMAMLPTGEVEIWNTTLLTKGAALITEHRGFASEGWFIGLISAIVLLLLILVILCFIKRSKGGKYSVKDKEDTQVDSEARPMKDETFGEYSDNDEKPFTSSQPSLNGDIKPLGSDDSLADYGGSVDVQFNEDGSFIGQYSGKKEKEAAGGNDSSGATSPVNTNIVIE